MKNTSAETVQSNWDQKEPEYGELGKLPDMQVEQVAYTLFLR